MEPEGSSPHAQGTRSRHSQSWARSHRSNSSVQVRGFANRCVTCWVLGFYCEQLSATRPTPKLMDHPLSAVRDCLFSIFWRLFSYITWGRSMAWWQGPIYHGKKVNIYSRSRCSARPSCYMRNVVIWRTNKSLNKCIDSCVYSIYCNNRLPEFQF